MAAIAGRPVQGRLPVRGFTPEIQFSKRIDNSRLVRVSDPRHKREMMMFAGALAVLFSLIMVYAWQHFRAIEYGYRIESLHAQHDGLVELNRALRVEQATLRDPERIDLLARRMGLAAPQAGQVMRMDAETDSGAPVLAQVSVLPPPITVPR
jgi:hypothetical protein